MLTFAAITPHTPLLLPSIGTEVGTRLAATTAAIYELHVLMAEAHIDTLIVASPHSTGTPDALSIQLHEHYQGDLSAFGDHATKLHLRTDAATIDKMQRHLRHAQLPVTLSSNELVDYGTTVPLALLQPASHTKLIPLAPGDLDMKTCFSIGEALEDVISHSTKRIGFIASAELSHRLSSDAPLGFGARAQEFDDLVRESLETNAVSRLLRLDPALVTDAAPCGLAPIGLLLGLLATRSVTPHTIAYEHPFGIGYLTARFDLG